MLVFLLYFYSERVLVEMSFFFLHFTSVLDDGSNRGVNTGLKSCLKIHKDLKTSENLSKILKIHEQSWNLWQFLNNSKIYEQFSKIYHNSQKSITIFDNLWTIRRKLLIHKLTTRPATAELDTAVNFFVVYK
jgi:hypothetical protein